jgi:acetolactate synthase-1/2/3 large subunit
VSKMNSWQAIVNALRDEGVKYIFGMPGNPRLLYDALYDCREINVVHAREQSSGVFMAMGYARAALDLGVCFGSNGPGMTNMVSGLLEAQAASVPLLAISAAVGTKVEGLPAFQEADQVGIARPVTKWAFRIPAPERVPWAVKRAIDIARSGCPGPVYLEIPVDLSLQEVDMPPYVPSLCPLPPRAAAEAMEQMVTMLEEASRPVVICGGGAVWSGAFAEVEKLADWGLPVLTTATGRGIIDEDHPRALGLTGLYLTRVGKEVYFDADLVLILGSRNDQFETGEWKYFPEGAKLVQVDIDPTALGRNWVPDLGVVGDVRLVLRDLLAALEERGAHGRWQERGEAIKEEKARYLEELAAECQDDGVPLKSKRIVWELGRVFGRNTILVNENGSQDLWSYYSPYFRTAQNGCVAPGAQTCMGTGVAGAIGVKLARPDQNVVCVTGDGAFQMYMRELPTAAQHNAPVTWVVLNNRFLGWIKFHQREMNERYIATDFRVQPDFAALARACGCYGEKVEDPGQITPALERALKANQEGQPAVLDFIVDGWDLAPGFRDFYRTLYGYK